MVAHTMSSLERTVLAQAMGMPYGERGTWISDVATYMTQPNRPGRDIVISPRSPPVASLVIACLSAPRPGARFLPLEVVGRSFVCCFAGRACPCPARVRGDGLIAFLLGLCAS